MAKTVEEKVIPLPNYYDIQYTYVENEGYLYIVRSDARKVCKINLSNPADFIEITIPKTVVGLLCLNGLVNVACSDADGYVIKNNVLANRPLFGVSFLSSLSGEDGYFRGILQSCFIPKPFVLLKSAHRSSSTWITRLAPAIIAPYMATINNLSNPVTKTASQTMKLRRKQLEKYNKKSNNIPKICLKFHSPNEVLEDYLSLM